MEMIGIYLLGSVITFLISVISLIFSKDDKCNITLPVCMVITVLITLGSWITILVIIGSVIHARVIQKDK